MPTGVVKPFNQDPFSPVLLSADSVVLPVSNEQKDYIKKVLDKACSDSRFADKAYASIVLILTQGITKEPIVTSLTPNSAEIGDPSFTLHVHGSNFKNTDKIVFAGVEEPTTFVSASELTTGVDMNMWLGPDALPVLVQSQDGVLSAPQTFTFTDGTPAALSSTSKTPAHKADSPHPAASVEQFVEKKHADEKKDEHKK